MWNLIMKYKMPLKHFTEIFEAKQQNALTLILQNAFMTFAEHSSACLWEAIHQFLPVIGLFSSHNYRPIQRSSCRGINGIFFIIFCYDVDGFFVFEALVHDGLCLSILWDNRLSEILTAVIIQSGWQPRMHGT